jgi:histone acetyltransferase (RNA polymerase elongator complex component)
MPMIIPFFIMNRGCPHRCLFCNERLTAGDRPERITEAAFCQTVRDYLDGARRKRGPIQIAFYGGTFTGMECAEQRRLLELAAPFLREGAVDGIRISTRPDEINREGLVLLKTFGVTTIEVGAQSLDDEVLLCSRRGHTAADTARALTLLRERGFTTGVHLMAGLPGDSRDRFAYTIERVIALGPDMVRIHPTIVLKDTPLAEAFREGRYLPLTLAEAVEQGKNALKRLTAAGIPVIRLGLQTTRELEESGAVVAGPFHPAFRTLVESALLREMAASLLAAAGTGGKRAAFTLAPADVSNFPGPRRGNIIALKERFRLTDIRVTADQTLPRLTLILTAGDRTFQTDASGGITKNRTEDLHAAR